MAMWLSALGGFVLSVALTWAAIVYARRRGLLDQPGKRRSHTQPTARGGGVGIIAAVLLVGVPAWWCSGSDVNRFQSVMFGVAVLAVAAVGWRDDHRPLPVLPRLLVHVGGALLVAAAALAPWAVRNPQLGWLLVPLVPLLAGFINAHNFMDGIDGILAVQGLFVTVCLAALATWTGAGGLATLAIATAAGCLGFLLFNAPPARIFMGDVGSGALGLVIAGIAAFVVTRNPATFWACAILPSAFLVDSGLTLARRVLAGQRWYAPHRQHLYQWLVRVNWTHARTDVVYMTWNLVVVAPLAWVAARWPMYGAWCCLAAYVLAAGTWYAGKRACLASLSARGAHGTA